jgi:hypothetical protein
VGTDFPVTAPAITYAFGPFGWTYTGPSYPASPQNPVVTYTFNYTNERQEGTVFLSGAALVAAGLISGIGMVALVLVSGSRPRLRKPAVVLGFLAFLLVLAAVLEVMLLLPAAANTDSNGSIITGFWGSAHICCLGHQEFLSTWGAGWAWYALLAAAVLFLIAGVVQVRAKTQSARQVAPEATQQP